MRKIMTVSEAYNFAMNEFPSLYSAVDSETSQLRYYDHIFNVIGNGFRDLNEFINQHTINKTNKHLICEFPEKYIGNHELFYGYTKLSEKTKMPEFNSVLNELFTEEEKPLHPEVVYWTSSGKNEKVSFYPNFGKTYSMVWKMNLSSLDISWTEAAIWYYEKAKEYFNSNNFDDYHGAWPNDPKKQQFLIQEFEERFNHYKNPTKTTEEFYSTISKEYAHPYDGDTKKFIQTKWEKELNRIHNFLDETISHLEQQLSLRTETRKKMKP